MLIYTYMYGKLIVRKISEIGATKSQIVGLKPNKKAVLPQGNRAMLQVFFSVEVRQQHSLQV